MHGPGTCVRRSQLLLPIPMLPSCGSMENRCQLLLLCLKPRDLLNRSGMLTDLRFGVGRAVLLGTQLLKGVTNEETNGGYFTSLADAEGLERGLDTPRLGSWWPAMRPLCYSLEEVKESIAELPQGLFDFLPKALRTDDLSVGQYLAKLACVGVGLENHSMVDKTSEDVRQTIDSLAPYPRLLRGIWEALGIKTGEEKDVQSRKQRKGSLTTLLEDYQTAVLHVIDQSGGHLRSFRQGSQAVQGAVQLISIHLWLPFLPSRFWQLQAPGCQHPVSSSKRALRVHMTDNHVDSSQPRCKIRRSVQKVACYHCGKSVRA
ncbi:hypothetical protein OOU_Y34scaffold00609g2 [Pyricularia oryzae Y34]|uniref:Uncharacterized protein n=2 Tax=Pyricularia oryzae TaxID=318829 RepID=A0AA97NVY5_PYRO3|nr:hypothetical protein OOU_Y34scaffold00609g2 [Pyricularia oryzae Y34]